MTQEELIEQIRAVKAMQTQMAIQVAALRGQFNKASADGALELSEQLSDAVATGENHAAALGHVITAIDARLAEGS